VRTEVFTAVSVKIIIFSEAYDVQMGLADSKCRISEHISNYREDQQF
jgi:hypothetical protein